MAEETTSGAGDTGDPAAVSLALAGASRDEADAYLRDQRAHLHEQMKQVHLDIWEKRLGVLLRLATGFMGVAVAAGLTLMVWNAAHSSGLLIESFSVPPDLAQRGMNGEVAAAKFLDQLSLMQSQTVSMRAARTYANNWSQSGIKLDIPETGVSLAELDDYLREKLGHDTRVSGEIVRTQAGLSLTARAGDDGAVTVTGSDADLDGLVQRGAEALYGLTQPFRYAHFLSDTNRDAESMAQFEKLPNSRSRDDRMWGAADLGFGTVTSGNVAAGLAILKQATDEEPDNILAWRLTGQVLSVKDDPEGAIRAFQAALSHLSDGRQNIVPAALIPAERRILQANIADEMGAYHDAEPAWAENTKNPIAGDVAGSFVSFLGHDKFREHDLAAARTLFANATGAETSARIALLIDADMEDWAGALAQAPVLEEALKTNPGDRARWMSTEVPVIAYAEAKLGRFAAAEARIGATPADCYSCLIARAWVAELQGQHARADWWFARAVDWQKSIPFAYSWWGQALLARGDADAAIEKFKTANQKGPHFADALEGWSEALMAKKDSGAATKFEEAGKYAPNWGKLHLKWGEALASAGKKDEAQKQFALAATLDLSAADKAELARQS